MEGMSSCIERLKARKQYIQRSPEWYAAREELLTASDVAAALDIKPYEGFRQSARAELLKKKTGQAKPMKGGASAVMMHGVKYEDEARRLYEEHTGERVHEFGLLIHEQYPWLGASPDGVSESGKVIEIKCPMSRAIVPGHVPEHYMPQVQICLEVCDLEEAVFIQYKPEAITWPKPMQLDITTIRRDREWFAKHLESMQAFWKEMMDIRQTQPPPPAFPAEAATQSQRSRTVVRQPTVCAIDDDMYA